MKGVRYAAAALLAALAVPVSVAAARWPLEAGSVLFTPMLLGGAALLVAGAVALAAPPRPRRPVARRTALDSRLLALCGALAVLGGAARLVRWVASWT